MLTMSADNAVSEAVVGNSDVLIDLSDHIVHAWIIRTHTTDLLDSTHVTKVCARKQARFD